MLTVFDPDQEVEAMSEGGGSGVVLTAIGTDEEGPEAPVTPLGVLFAILSQRLHPQWAAELAQAQHDALLGYMKVLPKPGKSTRMSVTYQPKEDVLVWEGIVSPSELIIY